MRFQSSFPLLFGWKRLLLEKERPSFLFQKKDNHLKTIDNRSLVVGLITGFVKIYCPAISEEVSRYLPFLYIICRQFENKDNYISDKVWRALYFDICCLYQNGISYNSTFHISADFPAIHLRLFCRCSRLLDCWRCKTVPLFFMQIKVSFILWFLPYDIDLKGQGVVMIFCTTWYRLCSVVK